MDRAPTPAVHSGKKSPRTNSFLHRLWLWFLAPSSRIVEPDQRRQATLLSGFLLGLIAGGGLVLSISFLSIPASERITGMGTTAATVGILAVTYGLSRTRFSRVAAVLSVFVVSMAVFVTGRSTPQFVHQGLFDYLILSILLGSLFLSLRGLAWLILIHLVALLVYPLADPQVTRTEILVGSFSFLLVASIVLIVTTRHRNLLEQDRQAELAEKEQRSRREADRAAALLRVAERLNAQLDLDTLLNAICEEVVRALGTPVSLISLYDPKKDVLHTTNAMGLIPELIKRMAPFPRALYDRTTNDFGTSFALPDLQVFSKLPNLELFKRLNLRSMAFATMRYEQELIGSLSAITQDETRHFTDDELLLLRGLADQAALAIVNTRLFKDSRRRLEHLQALRAIDVAIATNHDLQETLTVLLDQITGQLEVDAAVVLLLDETSQYLEYAGSLGFHSPTLRFTRLRLGEGIAGRAAQQQNIIRINDLRTDPQTLAFAPSLAGEGFVSYCAAPLITQGQVNGVLEIFHRSMLDPDPEWLGFLETLAGQAAIAIQSTSLFADLQHTNEELSQAYDSTIEGWSHALDLRDKETEGHTRRVTELTLELAAAFGFSAADLVQVRRGALLHDIGKMGVPDRILLKEGPLTDEEWILMRQHPVFAHEMLIPIDYLKPALDIPYSHHEKWDGTGYPRGLKGDEIPFAARIFAVVDVWDALTSDRPYRRGWSTEKTLAHIRAESGKHFEPQVVDKFVALLEKRPRKWE